MGSKGSHHGKVTVGGKAAARNSGYARPSRSAELEAAVRDTPRIRGRRSTRRWCRGKPSREHVPVIVLAPWSGRQCRPADDWQRGLGMYPDGWACQHREVCGNCQRVLREGWKLAPEECPVYLARVA